MSKTESTVSSETESVVMLARTLEAVEARSKQLEKENVYLREQLDWLKRQMFGNRSEKLPPALPGTTPGDLFGGEAVATFSSVVAVPAHERKVAPKFGHGREPLPEGLPVEEIILDVSEDEKLCARSLRGRSDCRAKFRSLG